MFFSDDPSQIGQYTVVISYELTEYPELAYTTSFDVTINPCQIEEFSATVAPQLLTYSVGAEAVTTFALSFS